MSETMNIAEKLGMKSFIDASRVQAQRAKAKSDLSALGVKETTRKKIDKMLRRHYFDPSSYIAKEWRAVLFLCGIPALFMVGAAFLAFPIVATMLYVGGAAFSVPFGIGLFRQFSRETVESIELRHWDRYIPEGALKAAERLHDAGYKYLLVFYTRRDPMLVVVVGDFLGEVYTWDC